LSSNLARLVERRLGYAVLNTSGFNINEVTSMALSTLRDQSSPVTTDA